MSISVLSSNPLSFTNSDSDVSNTANDLAAQGRIQLPNCAKQDTLIRFSKA